MRCERHRSPLRSLSWSGFGLTRATTHVHGCLGCQAEAARQERIARSMQQLRDIYLDPGPNLLSNLLANTVTPAVPLSAAEANSTPKTSKSARAHLGRWWAYLAAISGGVVIVGALASAARKQWQVS